MGLFCALLGVHWVALFLHSRGGCMLEKFFDAFLVVVDWFLDLLDIIQSALNAALSLCVALMCLVFFVALVGFMVAALC